MFYSDKNIWPFILSRAGLEKDMFSLKVGNQLLIRTELWKRKFGGQLSKRTVSSSEFGIQDVKSEAEQKSEQNASLCKAGSEVQQKRFFGPSAVGMTDIYSLELGLLAQGRRKVWKYKGVGG